MKKVLHISKYYFPFRGGTEQVAQDCVRALLGKYEQKVICFNDGRADLTDVVDGVEIIRAGCFMKMSSQSVSMSYSKRLKEIIKSFMPDIIIFHYPNPFVTHYLLRYIQKNCKLVVYWHLDIVKQKILKRFFVGQNKRLIKRADSIIATSPAYIEGSPNLSGVKEKCVIIPNCIDTERLQVTQEVKKRAAEIKRENDGKTICFGIGRHVPYKGYRYLIEAARHLDNTFKIYIGGCGPLTDELKSQAAGLENVEFLGKIKDDELGAYLTACDIFCFPSVTKNEAFGIALAEGMYFAKPAVTFTVPGSGVNYVSLDGVTGIECPNSDSKAYAEALKKLAENPELRVKYGKAANQRVLDNFTKEIFDKNLMRLIGEIDG